MDLEIVKQTLRLAGLNNLVVKFEPQDRRIAATFSVSGEKHSKYVSFDEIEDVFKGEPTEQTERAIQPIDGPKHVHSGPLLDEPPPNGA